MRADLSPRAISGEDARERGERQRDVLTFDVGGEVYALGIDTIREIIKNRPITEVPRVPPFVAGIIAVRGVVMPVIDLRLRLRLSVAALSRQARILVVNAPGEGPDGRETFGLLVDQVHHVVRLNEGDIEPPTMLSGHEADFVSGIGRFLRDAADPRAQGGAVAKGVLRQRDMLILLDLSRVLSFEHGGLLGHGNHHDRALPEGGQKALGLTGVGARPPWSRTPFDTGLSAGPPAAVVTKERAPR